MDGEAALAKLSVLDQATLIQERFGSEHAFKKEVAKCVEVGRYTPAPMKSASRSLSASFCSRFHRLRVDESVRPGSSATTRRHWQPCFATPASMIASSSAVHIFRDGGSSTALSAARTALRSASVARSITAVTRSSRL